MKMNTTIHSILDEFREAATSNRDLGVKFKHLIANHFLTDPGNKDKFEDVWFWGAWHSKDDTRD